MIHPSIQPDEPLAGYWPRVARWNGITEKFPCDFKRKFLDRLPENKFGESNLQKIATIAGLTTSEVLLNHGFISYSFVIKITAGTTVFNRSPDILGFRKKRYVFSMPRLNAAICPICTVEAIKLNGFSVWRREHQLPGVYWCLAHECRLLTITGFPERSMMQSPASWLKANRSSSSSSSWVDKIIFSAAIRRVYELQLYLLNLRAQLDPEKLRCSVLNRAIEIGAFAKNDQSEFSIRELIQDQFDHAWLMRVWPYFLRENNKNDEIKYLYQFRPSYLSPQHYAIVFAALWDSAEEAVAVMQRCVAVELHSSWLTSRSNINPHSQPDIEIAGSSMQQRQIKHPTYRSRAAGR